ncbi:MAG: hypothetical protein AAGJ87_14815 [Pseudomonadota bacterium]
MHEEMSDLYTAEAFSIDSDALSLIARADRRETEKDPAPSLRALLTPAPSAHP